jgi:hypothetical protein
MRISVRFVTKTSKRHPPPKCAQTRLNFVESCARRIGRERIVSRTRGRSAKPYAWTGRLESTLSRVIG